MGPLISIIIAWRNIWRNKTRSALTILAIGFACGILVFFVSLQFSSYSTSINASIRLFQGHLQVQRKGYKDEPRIRSSFGSAIQLQDEIRKLSRVEATGLRSIGFALASSEERSYGVSIFGVDPKSETKLSTIPGVVRQGRYLAGPNEVVLGSYLAKNLKVGIGDEVTVLGQGGDGSLAAGILKVVGTFETGSNELDRGMMHTTSQTFAEIFSLNDQAHALVVTTNSLDDVQPLENEIKELISSNPKLDVLRWDELVPGLKEAIELDLASGRLFFLSLIIIVAFSVVNTFWMAVLERSKEFAILLALGTKPRQIIIMLIVECVVLTSLGVSLGLLFGSALIAYFGATGFSVPGSEEIIKKWNVPAIVYTEFSWAAMLQGPTVLWVVAIISVLYPLARILKLEPVSELSGRA